MINDSTIIDASFGKQYIVDMDGHIDAKERLNRDYRTASYR
jgi:hypothetical protein